MERKRGKIDRNRYTYLTPADYGSNWSATWQPCSATEDKSNTSNRGTDRLPIEWQRDCFSNITWAYALKNVIMLVRPRPTKLVNPKKQHLFLGLGGGCGLITPSGNGSSRSWLGGITSPKNATAAAYLSLEGWTCTRMHQLFFRAVRRSTFPRGHLLHIHNIYM